MARETLTVASDLRAFMRAVAVKIDWAEDGTSLIGTDALQHECGFGERFEADVYKFTYIARDGNRWGLMLREQQIRDIAGGQMTEVEAEREDIAQRAARGEALIVWGEYAEDAMRIRTPHDLGVALDALHAIAEQPDMPQSFRLWSTADDQLFAVIYGEQAAIYIVEAKEGYGTSAGDPTRTETFEVTDHDVGKMVVLWSDCVSWQIARPALVRFAEHGDLGTGITLDGRIPGPLLILGDTTREAELATRGPPPGDPARTSLIRINPYARWARRLIDALRKLELIELLDNAVDGVTITLAELLGKRGEKALDSNRTVERLAREIGAIRGVDRMFATGGDLQVALRRSREG
jgi:hypothetical protein